MKVSPILLGFFLAAGGSLTAAAQASTPTVPQVLQITREYLKAGKNGMILTRSSSSCGEQVFLASRASAP